MARGAKEPCDGHLQVCSDPQGDVMTVCSECGEGYRFQIVIQRKEET
jgi:RNase P subunit RPR2